MGQHMKSFCIKGRSDDATLASCIRRSFRSAFRVERSCFVALSVFPVTLAVFFLGSSLVAADGPAKRALLVSVNDYPDPADQLFGCHHDADLVRGLLEEVYDFPPESIRLLRDSDVTAEGLTRAIKEHLIEGTKAGDIVVFYYAGHGTMVKDLDGDERDGIDEVLMTTDFDPSDPLTWYTDDLHFELFQRIPARQVLALHDCCHSGTGNRGAAAPDEKPLEGGTRHRFADAGFRSFDLLADAPDANSQPAHSILTAAENPNHIFFAACQDHQISSETVQDGRPHGLFTVALCNVLREDSNLPFEMLAGRIRDRVGETVRGGGIDPQDPAFSLGSLSKVTVVDFLARDLGLQSEPTRLASGEGIPTSRPATLDEVAPGYRPSGTIGVVLLTDRTEYAEDDLMKIELMVDHDAYVELYYYGVDDQVYRLFPNRFAADNFVRAGKKVEIPGKLGFDLRLHLPPGFEGAVGNEVLKVVASTKPFSEEESVANQEEVFRQIDGRKLNPAEARLIEVRAAGGREFGEAMVIYRIVKSISSGPSL